MNLFTHCGSYKCLLYNMGVMFCKLQWTTLFHRILNPLLIVRKGRGFALHSGCSLRTQLFPKQLNNYGVTELVVVCETMGVESSLHFDQMFVKISSSFVMEKYKQEHEFQFSHSVYHQLKE